jgi:hypothetical protein
MDSADIVRRSEKNRRDGPRPLMGFFFNGPMIAVQGYLAAVLAAFAWGPWPWPVANRGKLYAFLILAQIVLLLGYLSVGRGRARRFSWSLSWKHLLYVSFVLNAIWFYPNLVERTGHSYSSLDEIVSAIRLGFTEPGVAYKGNLEAMKERDGTSLTYSVTLLAGPLLSLMYPLGVLYWGLLGRGAKGTLLLLLLLDALTWVASGANKGMADIVILLPFLIFARAAMFKGRVSWRKTIVAGMAVVVLAVGFFASFSKGQIGRANNAVYNLYDYDAGIEADQHHIMLRYLPQEMRYGVAALMTYITQGYYGLSLCMELPYVPTYGLGNAYYTASWAGKYLGLHDISKNTYPARSFEASGWNDFVRWNSIYPWLASDLTFPGAALFMLLCGRLLALSWRDMVWGRHPVAASVFSNLMLMCVYIPANNQVLGFPRSGIGFIISFIWWMVSRKRD